NAPTNPAASSVSNVSSCEPALDGSPPAKVHAASIMGPIASYDCPDDPIEVALRQYATAQSLSLVVFNYAVRDETANRCRENTPIGVAPHRGVCHEDPVVAENAASTVILNDAILN